VTHAGGSCSRRRSHGSQQLPTLLQGCGGWPAMAGAGSLRGSREASGGAGSLCAQQHSGGALVAGRHGQQPSSLLQLAQAAACRPRVASRLQALREDQATQEGQLAQGASASGPRSGTHTRIFGHDIFGQVFCSSALLFMKRCFSSYSA